MSETKSTPAAQAETDLQQFSMGEPLSAFNTKLNSMVDRVNSQQGTLGNHSEMLNEINTQVLPKMKKKPYFFPVTSDLIACDYLQSGDAAFVIGKAAIDDGKMRFYRIKTKESEAVDGDKIIAITGSGAANLIAIYAPEELAGGLDDDIQSINTSLANLKDRVRLKAITIPANASFAATKALKGITRNYYKLSVSTSPAITTNTRAIILFDASMYTDDDLSEVRSIVANMLAAVTVSGGIEFYANKALDLKGHPLHFALWTFFN